MKIRGKGDIAIPASIIEFVVNSLRTNQEEGFVKSFAQSPRETLELHAEYEFEGTSTELIDVARAYQEMLLGGFLQLAGASDVTDGELEELAMRSAPQE